jgi:hypothetical protein
MKLINFLRNLKKRKLKKGHNEIHIEGNDYFYKINNGFVSRIIKLKKVK